MRRTSTAVRQKMWCLLIGACVFEFMALFPFDFIMCASGQFCGWYWSLLNGAALVCCLIAVRITVGVERMVSSVFLLLILALVVWLIDDTVTLFIPPVTR